ILELLEGGNQSHMIFCRMLQTGDIKKKWLLQLVSLRGMHFRFRAWAWKEPLVLQPVVNDGNSFPWQSEESYDVVGGIFADGNERILPSRQSSRDDPSIEHPFPVIFLRHPKRREVMNRRHQRARLGP